MGKEKEEKDFYIGMQELFKDYDVPLIERESAERIDVPLDEFMDVLAKKAASIVIKKFLSK